MKPTYAEVLKVAEEYREALCCAMRVITGLDTGTVIGFAADSAAERFVLECHAVGIGDGFGVRNDAILKRARDATAVN